MYLIFKQIELFVVTKIVERLSYYSNKIQIKNKLKTERKIKTTILSDLSILL